MSNNVSVGGKHTDVFRLVDSGSAYVPKQLDGSTSATSSTHRMIRLDISKQLDWAPNDDGTASLKIDNDIDNNTLQDMLDAVVHTAVSASTAVKIGERLYRNATKRFGDTPASLNLCLLLDYGAADVDDTTLMKFSGHIGYFKRSSGAWKSVADSTSAPQLEFVQVVTLYDYDCFALIDGATGLVDKTVTTAFVIPEAIGHKTRHILIKT